MKVFISGASGLVGGNCFRHFKSLGWDVVGSHFSFETDYTVPFDTLNPDTEGNFDLRTFNPDYILHCGALTWVDYCEEHPEESYLKTVTSTKNLVDIAQKSKSKLVYISTDYVFDGNNGPYDEQAEVNPISIYGKHKLEAEQYVLDHVEDSLVLRITNVYGDELRNKNFVSRLIEQSRSGEKVALTLPIDQYATPINAMDIARALENLMTDGKVGIYHLSSSDYVNRVELAMTVLSYFPGVNYDINPVTTKDLNPPAPRPLKGGLINKKYLGEYPDFGFSTVEEYLNRTV